MRRGLCGLLGLLCVVFTAHAQVRVGEDVIKRHESPHPYAAPGRGGAEAVRTDVITYPGAAYIAPHFSRFHLAEGDYLIVRSPDGSRSWRYEKLGKADLGERPEGFWGIHIAGDTAVIELHGKTGGEFGYVVDRFARGYQPEEMAQDVFGPEAICGGDDSREAKCYQFSEPAIYDKARAVARLLIQGSSLCTGWLIGSAGHLMTNHHCITSNAAALDTDYEFMAEGGNCATNCRTQLACPGVVEATSATLVQTDVSLDYSLVLLPANITPTYGFLRLRNALPAIDERIYVPGHPVGWGKQIAVASTHANDASGFCEIFSLTEPVCISGTVPEIGYTCDTQGGSSGSPVLAYSDHKVVALHHCSQGTNCSLPNRGLRIPNIVSQLGSNLPPGSVFDPVGKVRLDENLYGCSGVVGIEVRDDNLVGAGSHTVAITSTSEPVAETVTLNEVLANSGVFVGTIPAAALFAVNGDGFLSVADGDTITVTYIDADDGAGGVNVPRTDAATADCVAPVITNVQATNVAGTSADLTWNTNEAADSSAVYGLAASPPPTSPASSTTRVTSHSLHVTGLERCESYIFQAQSTDEAGNSASDDNQGAYYAFTTGTNTTPIYAGTGLPMPIPDNNPSGTSATIGVTDINPIQDLNVKIKITHTFDADVDIFLIAPDGTSIELSTDNGGSGDNYDDTIFDDEAPSSVTTGAAPFAGSFRPEQALSAFDGMSAAGTWTLHVIDDEGGLVGTIDSFELLFSYPAQPCGPFLRRHSHFVSDVCNGSGGAGIVDPGEDLEIFLDIANTGDDPTTNVSAVLSTSTPGVTIVTSSASYGSLPPNTFAAGSSPFTVQVGSEVPCGALISFQVDATATEGTWSDAFTVRVGSPSTVTTTYDSTDVPKAILDISTIISVLNVADTSTLLDVNVGLTLTHTYDNDLVLTLIGPDGARVTFSNQHGGDGDNYTSTVFDDQAAVPIASGVPPFTGSFRPDASLNILNGRPANGTWTLEITDVAQADVGNLIAWSVTLSTPGPFVCNPCLVAPPGEVGQLNWSAKDAVEWSAAPGATSYHLYLGDDVDLPMLLDASVDSCRRTTTAGLFASGLTEAPSSGSFDWWLVRAGNTGGEGPAGSASIGHLPTPRVNDSSGACP